MPALEAADLGFRSSCLLDQTGIMLLPGQWPTTELCIQLHVSKAAVGHVRNRAHRADKVDEGVQLQEVVLHGSACDDEPVAGRYAGQLLRGLGAAVLDRVSLQYTQLCIFKRAESQLSMHGAKPRAWRNMLQLMLGCCQQVDA